MVILYLQNHIIWKEGIAVIMDVNIVRTKKDLNNENIYIY